MVARTRPVQNKPATSEKRLLNFAEQIENDLTGRQAMHYHFSKLHPSNRQRRHMQMATQNFDQLTQQYGGESFLTRTGDLVVALKNAPTAEIDRSVLKLQYLFGEDPLMQNAQAGERPLCTWYDLEQDYDAFVHLTQAMHESAQKRGPSQTSTFRDLPAPNQEVPIEPLAPRQLDQLETLLSSTDVTPFLRRQPVCVFTSKDAPRPVFQETYVSVEALRRRIMPTVDLSANRWLFQHLTGTLDRRVLSVLPGLERKGTLPTSINLNVSTILSDAFLDFDAKLREQTDKTIIIEVQPVDIFADMQSFLLARDLAQQRGYKFCLDGHSHITFPMLHSNDFGVALQKVRWTPELEQDPQPHFRERLREAVMGAGRTRVVLNRCDDKSAIEFGKSLGIAMFQGRYIDELVN